MRRLFSLGLSVAAALAVSLILAGCTISSENKLIADTEGAAPLPDSFTFFPYEADADGYVPAKDAPAAFTRQGKSYVSTDMADVKGPLDVRFLPIGDQDYLVAASFGEAPDVVYGFARYADGVLSLALTPDADTSAAIDRERAGAMPKTVKALDGITVSQGTDAITLTTRSALDYLARMYVAGRLPMGRLSVAYIALNPNAVPPSRLVRDGRHWVKVP
ncbi:MAG: hypothetical protein P4M09_15890 [Devosia sp.]|nr:hypothetical protein [Devosia sp.]